MALTLVPAASTVGDRFWFLGPNDDECAGCPYRSLCFRLEAGAQYQVTGLRDVRHPCRIHDGDQVRVAEVEAVPFESSVEQKLLRGTAVQWAPVPCGRPDCANFHLCHPRGPAAGKRQVVEVGEPLQCPAGYDLARVRLDRI